MSILLLYFIFCVLVGVVAISWGRSGLLWFILSLFISPLLSLIILLIVGKSAPTRQPLDSDEGLKARCEQCHELIYAQAKICKHCGSERIPTETPEEVARKNRASSAETTGYVIAKMVKRPAFWAVVLICVIAVYLNANPDLIMEFKYRFGIFP